MPKTWIFQPQKDITLVTTLHPPASFRVSNPDEQRAFNFFKQNTAPQFAGHHELAQKFWNVFIPRSASNDDMIYKLAVAMGSRHEATLLGCKEASALAEKSHAIVISSMAKNLSVMKVDMSLLCCAMLMGYANLCEEVPATAAIHFSLGLKILREQASQQSVITDSMAAFIEPMFAELELATALFAMPPADIEVINLGPVPEPELPSTFSDLMHAKETLGDILGWLIYVTIQLRDQPTLMAAATAEADNMLSKWRQLLIQYSLAVAAHHPGLYLKARKMLFQYKLFGMCRGAARSSIFKDDCRVRVLSVDFSQPHVTSLVCNLEKNDYVDDSWRPLAPTPSRRKDEDDLDIWPQGEPVGHDGNNQVICITFGR